MKSCPSRFQNNLSFLSKGALVVLLLVALAGCSGGNIQTEADPPEDDPSASVTEIDELKAENEELQAELEKAMEELKEAESKVKGLEADLKDLQEAQAVPSPSPSTPVKVDLTPPELTDSDLLLGEWFDQEFHEDGIWSWTQSLVFNAGGTGTIYRTYYIPKAEIENADDMLTDTDMSSQFTWRLDGNTLHVDIDDVESESVDFTYSSEQQKFNVGDMVYVREEPSGMEEYAARALYAEDVEARKTVKMRKFLGIWYFDLITWTFNEDGTCIIDIPELANQPAATLEYTYSISDDRNDPTYLCLMLDSEKGTSYFYPEFTTDGSISLKGADGSEVMKLTRQFDMNNCPISTQIIQNGIDAFTGRMFYDMLGIEE